MFEGHDTTAAGKEYYVIVYSHGEIVSIEIQCVHY